MKEITVAVDDETYRLAEIEAAEKGVSLPEMLKNHLHDLTREAWGKSFLEFTAAVRAEHPNFSASENLPREELYDRDKVR